MSFDQLMTHANDIQFKATKRAIDKHETDPEYARRGVDGYYSDVPDLFKPFSQMPDPASYDQMIGDLRAVLHDLSNGETNADPLDVKEIYPAGVTILPKMSDADQKLGDWTGAAATAFKRNFLDPFPPICRNQFILVATLKGSLEAYQAMWASARTDIDKLAEATIDALDHADGGCCNSNTWNVSFTVLSSVCAGVAATLAEVGTEGAATPLVLQLIGAASQVAAVTPPVGPKEDQKPSGETAVQITNVMKQGMQ